MLIHHAGLDDRINAGWPAYQAALDPNGKVYEAYTYEGANHGFTRRPAMTGSSTLRRDRTLAHFAKYLT